MLGGTAKRQSLQPGVVGILSTERNELLPVTSTSFVVDGGEKSLAVKNADPVLRAATSQITVNVDAGSSKSSARIRVQARS